MAKKETQPTLPGIPAPIMLSMWRVNFQYQGPNYALRQGSLVIPAERIEVARSLAEETIANTHKNKWAVIKSIVQLHEEAPF